MRSPARGVSRQPSIGINRAESPWRAHPYAALAIPHHGCGAGFTVAIVGPRAKPHDGRKPVPHEQGIRPPAKIDHGSEPVSIQFLIIVDLPDEKKQPAIEIVAAEAGDTGAPGFQVRAGLWTRPGGRTTPRAFAPRV